MRDNDFQFNLSDLATECENGKIGMPYKQGFKKPPQQKEEHPGSTKLKGSSKGSPDKMEGYSGIAAAQRVKKEIKSRNRRIEGSGGKKNEREILFLYLILLSTQIIILNFDEKSEEKPSNSAAVLKTPVQQPR